MEEAERRGGGVEHSAWDKQELPGGDLKEGPFWEDQCALEVALPPERAEGREGPGQLFGTDGGERAANREGPRWLGKKRLNVDALQCDVSVEEDNHQEWTFTLYGFDNSGKATREDMSSLMHTIYEVVDASVSHSSGGSKTLRVKLTVSPEPAGKRREGPPAVHDREPIRCRTEGELAEDPRVADKRLYLHIRRPHPDAHLYSERGSYCVDENTERRNHYLDLAGIENYTSRFGPGRGGHGARGMPAGPGSLWRTAAAAVRVGTHGRWASPGPAEGLTRTPICRVPSGAGQAGAPGQGPAPPGQVALPGVRCACHAPPPVPAAARARPAGCRARPPGAGPAAPAEGAGEAVPEVPPGLGEAARRGQAREVLQLPPAAPDPAGPPGRPPPPAAPP
uniref:Protein naked cuticle homolog n=1 Tax=Sus scrofa TaxID=9823 RepID=A0A8D0PH93_PIG